MHTSSNESDDENYKDGNDTTLFDATLPKVNDTKWQGACKINRSSSKLQDSDGTSPSLRTATLGQ